MRMNLAIGSPVNRFLAYLMAHPERFQRSEVPCCLQALWEDALEGRLDPSPLCTAHVGDRESPAPSTTSRPNYGESVRPAFRGSPQPH